MATAKKRIEELNDREKKLGNEFITKMQSMPQNISSEKNSVAII